MKIINADNRDEVYNNMISKPISMQFPAFNGFTVLEGHAKYCRENGHTLYLIDETFCQRCGDEVK